jgi:uncharacterized protein YkwD
MARGSVEQRVGAWAIKFLKLGVVGFALVGVIYLAQPSLLGGLLGGSGTNADVTTATPTPAGTPTSAPADDTAGDVAGDGSSSVGLSRERIEELTHRAVNEHRQQQGLSPIAVDENLKEIARGHSQEMAMQGYFAHESPSGGTFEDRYDTAGYYCRVDVGDGYLTGGENIYKMTLAGKTVSNGEVAEAAATSWMNSPEHRQNILRPQWDDMGIGVYILESGSETTIYVTQNFC